MAGNYKAIAALVAGLTVFGASQSFAAPLILKYDGVFGATSSLNGIEFGDSTAFSFEALFDSDFDLEPTNGFGIFAATVTFDIEGFGSVISAPGADLTVELADPDLFGSGFDVGLADVPVSGFFFGFFDAADPAGFDADSPVPTVFSNLTNAELDDGIPFVISTLQGDLIINEIESVGETAEIVAVPEPAPILIMALGLGALGLRLKRRTNR